MPIGCGRSLLNAASNNQSVVLVAFAGAIPCDSTLSGIRATNRNTGEAVACR